MASKGASAKMLSWIQIRVCADTGYYKRVYYCEVQLDEHSHSSWASTTVHTWVPAAVVQTLTWGAASACVVTTTSFRCVCVCVCAVWTSYLTQAPLHQQLFTHTHTLLICHIVQLLCHRVIFWWNSLSQEQRLQWDLILHILELPVYSECFKTGEWCLLTYTSLVNP